MYANISTAFRVVNKLSGRSTGILASWSRWNLCLWRCIQLEQMAFWKYVYEDQSGEKLTWKRRSILSRMWSASEGLQVRQTWNSKNLKNNMTRVKCYLFFSKQTAHSRNIRGHCFWYFFRDNRSFSSTIEVSTTHKLKGLILRQMTHSTTWRFCELGRAHDFIHVIQIGWSQSAFCKNIWYTKNIPVADDLCSRNTRNKRNIAP